MVLIVGAILLAPLGSAQCPARPRDCYALIPDMDPEEPFSDEPDTDTGGVAAHAGVYKQPEDEGNDSQTYASIFRSVQAAHTPSPVFSAGDHGGIAFVFGPGASPARDNATHVNITVVVPDDLRGIVWAEGNPSLSFEYNLTDGGWHYEVLPFTVTSGLVRDLVVTFTVTAHPGEEDEASGSNSLLIAAVPSARVTDGPRLDSISVLVALAVVAAVAALLRVRRTGPGP